MPVISSVGGNPWLKSPNNGDISGLRKVVAVRVYGEGPREATHQNDINILISLEAMIGLPGREPMTPNDCANRHGHLETATASLNTSAR